jgi:hypothetical protein
MKNHVHLKNCKDLASYVVAITIRENLKEYARENKLNHRHISILSKKEVLSNGTGPADAQIHWGDCPEGVLDTQLELITKWMPHVSAFMVDHTTLSIFDV